MIFFVLHRLIRLTTRKLFFLQLVNILDTLCTFTPVILRICLKDIQIFEGCFRASRGDTPQAFLRWVDIQVLSGYFTLSLTWVLKGISVFGCSSLGIQRYSLRYPPDSSWRQFLTSNSCSTVKASSLFLLDFFLKAESRKIFQSNSSQIAYKQQQALLICMSHIAKNHHFLFNQGTTLRPNKLVSNPHDSLFQFLSAMAPQALYRVSKLLIDCVTSQIKILKQFTKLLKKEKKK